MNNNFGHYLKRRRTQLGYSQHQIAKISGFTPGYICTLENGKATPSMHAYRHLTKILEDLSVKKPSFASLGPAVHDKPQSTHDTCDDIDYMILLCKAMLNDADAKQLCVAFQHMRETEKAFEQLGITCKITFDRKEQR